MPGGIPGMPGSAAGFGCICIGAGPPTPRTGAERPLPPIGATGTPRPAAWPLPGPACGPVLF